MLMITGIISIVLTILSFVCVCKNSQKRIWLAFGAMTFMVITVLLEYHLVCDWVVHKDWSALEDVVPIMFPILCIYAIVILICNGFAICKK